MIQRIQSLYLLFAIIFMVTFACMPYATISTTDATYSLLPYGLETAAATDSITVSTPNFTVAILSGLTALLSLIAIFLFKNRRTQVLLCKVNTFLYITIYVVMALYAFIYYADLQASGFSVTAYVIFPVCAIIVNSIAISAINKDERMVRDSERMWSRKN